VVLNGPENEPEAFGAGTLPMCFIVVKKSLQNGAVVRMRAEVIGGINGFCFGGIGPGIRREPALRDD
jgi:hypothetical protein